MRRTMQIMRRAIAAVVLLSCMSTALALERHALLIGVGAYEQKPLQGPKWDVRALCKLLNDDYGFDAERIQVLLDGGGERLTCAARPAQAATKTGILDAVESLLHSTRPGDHIFIYFSGHGTSAQAKGNDWPLPYNTAALVPWGYPFKTSVSRDDALDALVVGRTDDPDDRDLRALLEKLDDQDPTRSRHIFVAVDACYSARAFRSIARLPTRTYPQSFTDEEGFDDDIIGPSQQRFDRYPYHHTFIVSAAAEDQEACDIPERMLGQLHTFDDNPHGGFTDALIRVLQRGNAIDGNGDGIPTYGDLFDAVRSLMSQRQFGHDPTYHPIKQEGGDRLRAKALFSGADNVPAVPPQGSPQSPKPGPLRVALDIDDPALRKKLGAIKQIALVGDAPEIRIRRHAAGYVLCSGGDEQVAAIERADSATLTDYLRHQAWAKRLRAFRNPKQTFALSLDFNGTRQAGLALQGEKVEFAISTDRKAYPVLIDVDPAGAITVLYPVKPAEVEALGPSRHKVLPDDSFRIEVRPPFGIDDVVLLGFSRRTEALEALVGAAAERGDSGYERLAKALTPTDADVAFNILRLKTQSRANADAACR
jgi:hypothetical protein